MLSANLQTDNQSDQPTVDANASPNLSSTEFNTDKGGIPNVAVPQPAPIVQHNMPQPPQQVNTGSGSGDSSPFGAIGAIGGAISNSIGPIGDLLGFIGLAQGGTAAQGHDKAIDMALGYLTGALHQQKYGGTPDTLQQAAQEVRGRLQQKLPQQQQPFAGGGEATSATPSNPQMDQIMLMKALGLIPPDNGSSMDNSNQQQQPQQQPNAFAGGGQSTIANPNAAQAPLQPGQEFQGDGSVKGPGGPQDDAIPARLSNGEFVFSQPAVQFFGVDKLTKQNEQGKQGFMQVTQQVQANQPGAANGPPGAPQSAVMSPGQSQQSPQAMPSQQPPMAQAKGGPSVTMRKGSGYMGL